MPKVEMLPRDFFQTIPRPVKTYHRDTYPRLAIQNVDFHGHGKTLFIAGGATGIGFATALAFAAAGVHRIVIVSRSRERLEKAKTALVAAHPKLLVDVHAASVTDYTRISAIMLEIESIDILLFSAVREQSFNPPAGVGLPEMEELFQTNLFAPFEMTKTFLAMPQPKSGGQKTLLSISSCATHVHLLSAYGASKAAFAQMLQHFAEHEANKPAGERTRMFCYHPGIVYTDGGAKYRTKESFDWEEIRLPADFAIWLAGTQSDFLQGRYLWAEWDVDELIALKDRIAADTNFLKIGLTL